MPGSTASWWTPIPPERCDNQPVAKRFSDFYAAWIYLSEHQIYKDAAVWHTFDDKLGLGPKRLIGKRFRLQDSHFPNEGTLDLMVVKVNPKNKKLEDDASLNTLTQVWL